MASQGVSSGGEPSRSRARSRGAAAIIGLVILFGVVIVAAGFIFVSSTQVKDELSEQEQLQKAENSMKQFATEVDTISVRSSVSTTATFPEQGRTQVYPGDEGKTTITVELNPDGDGSSCKVTLKPGEVRHESVKDTTFVYEAGAIWRIRGGEVTAIRSPDLGYQNQTIAVDVPKITGSVADSKLELSQNYETSSDRSKIKETALVSPLSSDSLDDPNKWDKKSQPYDDWKSNGCRPRKKYVLTVDTSKQRLGVWEQHVRTEFPTGTEGVSVSVDDSAAKITLTVKLDAAGTERFRAPDSDDDGVADGGDNCPHHYNPEQANTDKRLSEPDTSADTYDAESGDVCDIDDDGDTVPDYRSAVNGDNPGDDSRDAGFITPGYFSAEEEDGDMWLDYVIGSGGSKAGSTRHTKDNCPKTYNPQQRDLDGDGLGDPCDPDQDGDDVLDKRETCSRDYNPENNRLYPFGFRDLPDGYAGPTTTPGEDADGDANATGTVPPRGANRGHVDNPGETKWTAYEDPHEAGGSTDDIPNVCDPDDDGDGYPDFGYYHEKGADEDFFTDSGKYQYYWNSSGLLRDPAGSHDGAPPGPIEDREDNCWMEPNTAQDNFDLKYDGGGSNGDGNRDSDFRDTGGNGEPDTRGNACDDDNDNDGIVDANEWETGGDEPCVNDANYAGESSGPSAHDGHGEDSVSGDYDHPDEHGKNTKLGPAYGNVDSKPKVGYKHGEVDNIGLHDDGHKSLPDTNPDGSKGQTSDDHKTENHNHDDHCHEWDEDEDGDDDCVDWETHHKESFKDYKKLNGEPHGDGTDTQDDVIEQCESGDFFFKNGDDVDKGHENGGWGDKDERTNDRLDRGLTDVSALYGSDAVFRPQPACSQAATPDWDTKVGGTPAHELDPIDVLRSGSHESGCKPTKPPKTFTEPDNPRPTPAVVSISISVVQTNER